MGYLDLKRFTVGHILTWYHHTVALILEWLCCSVELFQSNLEDFPNH